MLGEGARHPARPALHTAAVAATVR